MGMRAFLVGVAVAPLVPSSSFLCPSVGIRSSTFASVGGDSIAPRAGSVVVKIPASSSVVSMSSADVDEVKYSREQFWGSVSAGMAAAVAAGGCAAPALADSTGKYSSKATARKRYLPRIVRMVSAFQQLKKDIASGSAAPKSDFFVEVLPDAVAAMDLYGSSMKKGELPDSKSKALQQLAQDFGSTCGSIAKSLGKKGAETEAGKAYDKASAILVQYLQGVELEPLGSDVYG